MHDYFRQLQTTLATIDDRQLEQLRALVLQTAARGGTVWTCGNGGSAAVAAHWACDLQKAAGVRCQALGSNGAVLTAWANDEGYSTAIGQELRVGARRGDCLVALSCSGTSPNIVGALRGAWLMKIPRALITRANGIHPTPIDVLVEAPTADYGIAEDCFAAIGHWLTLQARESATRSETRTGGSPWETGRRTVAA